MNLIVTDRCNRSCSYCFARLKVGEVGEEKARPRHISIENVDRFLRFLHAGGLREFKILGGEPTLHPEFPLIVDRALEMGFSAHVFTNGLWPDSTAKRIAEGLQNGWSSRVSFVFNVHPVADYRPGQAERLENSLSAVGRAGSLGVNIYREEFDLSFASEWILAYGLDRRVRLGLASPIVGAENECLPSESFREVGRRLMEELRRFEKQDILAGFDCGFPLCMFEERELGELFACSSGFQSVCHPPLDVGPDLSIWPCFPLSNLFGAKLDDFADLHACRRHYEAKLRPFEKLGIFDRCRTCRFLDRGQCHGGCVARKIRYWQEDGDPDFLRKIARIADAHGD